MQRWRRLLHRCDSVRVETWLWTDFWRRSKASGTLVAALHSNPVMNTPEGTKLADFYPGRAALEHCIEACDSAENTLFLLQERRLLNASADGCDFPEFAAELLAIVLKPGKTSMQFQISGISSPLHRSNLSRLFGES